MPRGHPTKHLPGPDFPVYRETCGTCEHTQQWHIGLLDAATLSGKMVPCRAEGCTCKRWEPTWE